MLTIFYCINAYSLGTVGTVPYVFSLFNSNIKKPTVPVSLDSATH
jgi:hypothetical protein